MLGLFGIGRKAESVFCKPDLDDDYALFIRVILIFSINRVHCFLYHGTGFQLS